MELDAVLRSEVAKLWATMDVVAPRIAAPRIGWFPRIAAFLRGCAVQMTTNDSNGIGKLRVREDGLLAQEVVENGRLGITGVEDESRTCKPGDHRFLGSVAPAAGTRVEQGAPEGSGAIPVLGTAKAIRVLEKGQFRLQDAGLGRTVNDFDRARQ